MKNLAQIINNREKFILKTGFGDMFAKYSLKERDYKVGRFENIEKELFGINDLLAITKPDIVAEVFERFLKVGVDIIATNSELSNREALKEFGLEEMTYELNLNAAKLAREEVSKYSTITIDKQRFAAGCVSSLNIDLDTEILKNIYIEQVKALFAGKIDLLFFKNFKDKKNADSTLESLNDLMLKRNKTANILFSSNNKETAEYINQNILSQKYSNVYFITNGFSIDLNNSTEKDFETFSFNLCSLSMKEKISEEKLLVYLELLKQNKNVKVICIEENFPPDLANKVVNILQK